MDVWSSDKFIYTYIDRSFDSHLKRVLGFESDLYIMVPGMHLTNMVMNSPNYEFVKRFPSGSVSQHNRSNSLYSMTNIPGSILCEDG